MFIVMSTSMNEYKVLIYVVYTSGILLFVVGSWFLAVVVAGLPLFGFSKYVPEGLGLWCSIKWHMMTIRGQAYIVFIFVVGFFLPIVLITFCYTKVLLTVKKVIYMHCIFLRVLEINIDLRGKGCIFLRL